MGYRLCVLTLAHVLGVALLVSGTLAAPARGGAAGVPALPLVNTSAFRGQGLLAFLWDRRPYLLDGTQSRLLPLPAAGTVSQLAWSPNGCWLAYRDAGPSDRLWLVSAASGAAQAVGGLPARLGGYQWLGSRATLVVSGSAAHGRSKAWLVTPPGRALWVADRRGLGAHQITAAGHSVSAPQWSGDGRHLLYWRENALWLIDTRGGQPMRVLGPFPGPGDGFGFYGTRAPPSDLAWNRQ